MGEQSFQDGSALLEGFGEGIEGPGVQLEEPQIGAQRTYFREGITLCRCLS